ncbi:hypothetical protein H2199_000615 [Coniosporium tulheliwenetii]|uniref:Uncharacterized protein n=1 Tax=Coniosporium tulheliwenetii TaxID=3383036 RepID=A0ACC2ZMH7_9PEZI|nr:hypothetical protein H2199_000615 [Cladosporium sp. JES 115]
MKQRFSSLDVKVIAHELSNSLTSLRVTNIYDLSSHRRRTLPFVTRLRKYLKTRRVTSIAQVGTDRIIEFQFSDGLYRLFLEFYAAGNLVLTDRDLNIIALFREVSEGAEHERQRVGLQYNLSLRQNYGGVPPLTKERVIEGLQKASAKQQDAAAGKKKTKPGDALRKALAVSINEFPPMLVDHALKVVDLDTSVKPEQVLQEDLLLDKLMLALEEARRVIEEITGAETAKGYIIAKEKQPSAEPKSGSGDTANGSSRDNLIYDDFHPFRPKQFEDDPSNKFLEFEGFNKTVDEFYSSIEGQKLESKLQEREEAAKKKLAQARQDHEKRLGGLQQVQELNVRKAQAIEANLDRVEEAKAAINGLIEKGMDWVDVARLIENEQKRRNPVAEMIKLPLKLYENTATLLLSELDLAEEEDFEGEETESENEESEEEVEDAKQKSRRTAQPVDKRLTVDIDLGLSAYANARQYYDQKRVAAVKEEKTMAASSKALKSTERKIEADLKKGLKQEKDVLRPVRKAWWFEKFIYFVSSDGYLVLGGKDAQQDDILYNRYLKKGDVYVHADLQGAAHMIIKNKPSTPDAPIPPSTLSQAGSYSICTSTAWESKAVMSAWWINSDQVSKTASNGDYLPAGEFRISGTKNYLPPAQLLLGFAVIFEISEESKPRHSKHRLQDKTIAEDVQSASVPVVDEVSAEADSAQEPQTAESDSDEDFPDAKLESDSDDSEDEEDSSKARSNPLQSDSAPVAQPEQEVNPDESDAEELRDEDDERVENAINSAAASNSSKGGHRHLSAAERRRLRNPNSSTPTTQPTTDNEADNATEPGDAATQAGSTAGAPLPRGKRGKAKKLATKYANQDEEDRALALRLLGSKPSTNEDPAAAFSGADKQKFKEEELAAQKQRRREQHQRTQAAGKAAEEARRAALEKQDHEADEGEDEAVRLSLANLDALVGRSLPGDDLLSAIPVCAPWAALANYKYKVKLQPGAVKKGKAVKEILGRWDAAGKDPKIVDKASQDPERIWPREVELIRGWRDAEVFGIVPVGKVRVVLSGGGGGGGGGGKDKGGGKGKKPAARGGRGSKKSR